MRIALNLLFDGAQTTGAGLYGYRLAAQLALLYPEHQIVACLHPSNAAKLGDRPPNLRLVYGRFPLRSRAFRRLWEQLVLPLQLTACRADLVHSPDNTGLLFSPCAQVVSVLDLLFLRYPRLRFERGKRLWYRVMVPLSLRRARGVMTLSQATADDLRVLLWAGREGTPSSVVAPGVDPPVTRPPREMAARRRAVAGDGPYILAVGPQEPIKDHATLLRAYALLRRRRPYPPRLVIAGREERATPVLHALREELGVADSVTFAGYVPRDTLAALYAGATLLAFPSLGEGFGLPPLEAMGHGVPVVAAATGPLPETLGDAALLVPPGDALALAAAMESILDEPALGQDLIKRGREVAARYTWPRCARETMAVYRRALSL